MMRIPNKHIPTRAVRDETAQKALIKTIDRPSMGPWALWSIILELRERIDELEERLNVPVGQRWADRHPSDELAISVPESVAEAPARAPYTFSAPPPAEAILSAQDISSKPKKKKVKRTQSVSAEKTPVIETKVEGKESTDEIKDDIVGL
jgi:hypothetical protein